MSIDKVREKISNRIDQIQAEKNAAILALEEVLEEIEFMEDDKQEIQCKYVVEEVG
jgi:hypothetical protein